MHPFSVHCLYLPVLPNGNITWPNPLCDTCCPPAHQNFPGSMASFPSFNFYFFDPPLPTAAWPSAPTPLDLCTAPPCDYPPHPHPSSCLLPQSADTGRWRTLSTGSWCNVTLPSDRCIAGYCRMTSARIFSRCRPADSLSCPVGVCPLSGPSPIPPPCPPGG